MSWLKDTRFWVGVAVGAFIVPRVVPMVRSKMG